MRKASELNKMSSCLRRRNIDLSTTSNHALVSGAVKAVTLRMLKGEKIANVSAELEKVLEEKGHNFENRTQKERVLESYDRYIRRYVASEGRVLQFPRGNEVVNLFGEDVIPNFDFYTVNGDNVEVCKIKTSSPGTQKSSNESLELYAMSLWAKKMFPNATKISSSYYHLKGPSDTGKGSIATMDYYDERATKKHHEQIYDAARDSFFEGEYKNLTAECSPDDCVSCPQNNICHYIGSKKPSEEPKSVKPVADIMLSDAQEEAIAHNEGVGRINAGAGAGKTLVVAMNIVNLLMNGAEPDDICLLTFTNSGALEMTERIQAYCAELGLDVDTSRITSATFNSFCQKILEERYMELGFLAPPDVIDDETKCGVIKEILDKYSPISEWDYLNFTMNMARAKGALWSAVETFAQIKKNGWTRLNHKIEHLSEPSITVLFQAYEDFCNLLKARNLVEYDDQLLMVFDLLKSDPTLFDKMGFRHIVVDEFQDTDLPQIKLLQEMINTPKFKSFLAVGDDSQAIFSFRNTSPEYLIDFFNYFGAGKDYYLLENHRSQAEIIKMANRINAMNVRRVEKDLVPTKAPGIIPIVQGFYSQDEEYEYIANEIEKKVKDGVRTSDICFIGYTKYELQKMADILAKKDIPVVLMNPEPYIENSKVKAVLSFGDSYHYGTTAGILELLNIYSGNTLLANYTDKELDKLITDFKIELEATPQTKQGFMDIVNQLDPDKEDEVFQSFLEKVERRNTIADLYRYLHDFEMYGQKSAFKKEAKYDGVVLTTAHSSKGLEWDHVYCSVTKFDGERYHVLRRDDEEVEERRRLLFVTLTRARKELYVTGDYTAYNNEKEGRVINQYLRNCYSAIGKDMDVDFNEYFIRQKKAQLAAKQNKAKASGVSLDSLVKRTARKDKLIKELEEQFAKAYPGKDFYIEQGFPNADFLEEKDIKAYIEMYAKKNVLSELNDLMARLYPGQTLESAFKLKKGDVDNATSEHLVGIVANIKYLEGKTPDEIKELREALNHCNSFLFPNKNTMNECIGASIKYRGMTFEDCIKQYHEDKEAELVEKE